MSDSAWRFEETARVAVVGAGRLGSSLAQAMAAVGYRVVAVSSRRADHRAWLAERLPATETFASAPEAAAAAEVVFISVPDDAVEDVCKSTPWRRDQAAVHCAGVLPLDALRSAAEAGAATGALHPMQTFSAPGLADAFRGVTFAVEAGDSCLREWLSDLTRALGGEPFAIASEQRDAYHASAVMACGLTAGLAGLAADMWAQFGQDRGRGLRALMPLIKATAAAVESRGIPSALTGPYVRGDVATVRRHLEAVRKQSPDVARAYAALALATLPIAREQGGLTQEAEDEIGRELRAALRDLPGP